MHVMSCNVLHTPLLAHSNLLTFLSRLQFSCFFIVVILTDVNHYFTVEHTHRHKSLTRELDMNKNIGKQWLSNRNRVKLCW